MAIIKKTPIQKIQEDSSESRKDAIAIVQKIREEIQEIGLTSTPLEIESLIKHYGIQIIHEDMEDDLSGFIEKRDDIWIVGVNRYQSPRRQRFTLAHELGHFFMHKSDIELGNMAPEKILLRSTTNNTNIIEIEANTFASELLMPKEEFLQKVNSGIRQISTLADIFEVSIAAIRYRAFTLGLIKAV